MEVQRPKPNENMNDDQPVDSEFMNLNDDCILELLQRLSLFDLCKMSDTCVRLRILAGICFKRKYPQLAFDEMEIGRTSGEIFFLPNSLHVKFFSEVMPNLKIKFPSERDADMVQLIRKRCRNLKMIIFDGGCLLESYGSDLEDVLKTVETVVFLHSVLQTSNFVEILKHCPRLKQLALHEHYGDNKLNEVFLGTYPTLQHLKYIHEGTISLDNLTQFFQQNSIVTITLYFCDLLQGTSNDNILDLIRCIAKNGIHLVQLSLSFYGYFDWTEISKEIEFLCEHKYFKHLELKFQGHETERMLTEHGSHIASHKCVKAIHFEDFGNLQTTLIKMGEFPYLKNLHICDVRFGNVTPSLVKVFPNLKQIQITGLVDYDYRLDNNHEHVYGYNYAYNDVISMFVCYLEKLTKILICGYIENWELDYTDMNSKRQSLQFAGTVTILKSEFFGYQAVKLNLIKIKHVEFRHDECNFHHPLTSYFPINEYK